MREIKFRQPRLNINGEFIDWFYWGFTDQGGFTAPLKHHLPNYQYTGLKDKNGIGEELWEGDIVKAGDLDIIMIIVYYKSGFYLAFPDGGISAPLYPFIVSEYIERIGNIYENPELMEK